MDDRRQSSRSPLKVPVVYGAVDAFFTEFASNVNEGGMFIETDSPAEIDEMVDLQFSFPGIDGEIQINARVAWISDGKGDTPPGMGLEFQDLDAATKDAINQAVRKLRTTS